MYPHSNWFQISPHFIREIKWKGYDIIDTAFSPPPPHPLVSFLPSKKDYSLTTKLLMRAWKKKTPLSIVSWFTLGQQNKQANNVDF